MFSELTSQTLQKCKDAIRSMRESGLLKATVDSTTGMTGYNLQAPANLIVPILSPFRQSVGRVTIPGKGTNWKYITAVTPEAGQPFFAAFGAKAKNLGITMSDASATYRSYGRVGSVEWEGQVQSRNFEDARARTETLLLLQVLKEEELVILGGNRTALGTPAGVATATATTGGTVAAATYQIRVAALTLEGMARASKVSRPARLTNNYTVPATAVTIDASFGITAAAANTQQITTGAASTITVTWTAIPGAAGYAIWIDNKLQIVVPAVSKVVLLNVTTGGAAVPSADSTASTSAFDGILAQLVANGAYLKRLNAPMSSASGTQVPELADMLSDIYDRVKEEPDRLLMGWTEADAIDNKLAAVSNDRLNLNIQVNGDSPAASMPKFTSYKTPRGKVIPIEENPNIPGGMILALKDSVAIPNSDIPSPWQMHMGQELTRLEYAMTAPLDEFEIRGHGALAGYAPTFQGVIYDIQPA